MAKFCGGFKFDETLKIDKGVVTTAEGTADLENVVTACGQPFDGAVFKVIGKTITAIEAEDVTNTVSVCGTNFDAAYFSIVAGALRYTAPILESVETEVEEEAGEPEE